MRRLRFDQDRANQVKRYLYQIIHTLEFRMEWQ